MKMKPEEIIRLAGIILNNLKTKSLIAPKGTDDRLSAAIQSAILKNLQDEESIEQEVKKIMEQYKVQISSGTIDPQKAYMMIKKQVAKDRKFIL